MKRREAKGLIGLMQKAGDRIDQTLRYGRVKVLDDIVTTPSGSGSLKGATASLDSAGDIDRRITATRLILTGPLAFGLRKKKDTREMFLVVEGEGFAHVEPSDPKQRQQALKFVAEFNTRARQLVADNPEEPLETPAADANDDPTAKLARLAELHEAGALSAEEFAEAKRRVLGTL